MKIVVQKFGGTSLKTIKTIKKIAKKIIETKKQKKHVIVIVSAMGKFTDKLLLLSNEINNNPSNRELDMLLSTGEQISISLLSMAIQSLGYKAISMTGFQAGILTDNNYQKAKIIKIENKRLKEELKKDNIIIVAGFQGKTKKGEITTLGRGGSDTTAIAIASSMNADVCEIYTDVNGVYTADPRIVKKAQKINFISYSEMLELSSLGALVLQTKAVEYAKKYKIKIHVRSSFNNKQGTIVEEINLMEKTKIVKGVAHDLNVAKITVYGIPDIPGMALKLFKTLADNNINVDMIVQTNPKEKNNDISFTVNVKEANIAINLMKKIKNKIFAKNITLRKNLAKISIIGAGMQSNPGVAADMFEALAESKINIELISTSEIKISCLIEIDRAKEAIKVIHNKFKLEK